MSDLRIATRASRLALVQAEEVGRLLREAHPALEVSIVEVSTTGDRDRMSSVATLTEVGAFVRAVQQTVLEGKADIAVHSCKDLPVDGPSDLGVFYPGREAPWDVMCGDDLETLPDGARVGTGSPRRTVQLRLLRPDLEVEDIRGNVDTRLDKMHSGEYQAVVLAEAGLRRLGRQDEIRQRFSVTEMVPAPAQGVLAVEAGVDGPAAKLLAAIDDEQVREAVEAERALLALTRAGCRSALGALAVMEDGEIAMTGFVEDEKGSRFAQAKGTGPDEAARNLQRALEL